MDDSVSSPAGADLEPRQAPLDCAWCGLCFEDIDELLGHVDTDHLEHAVAA